MTIFNQADLAPEDLSILFLAEDGDTPEFDMPDGFDPIDNEDEYDPFAGTGVDDPDFDYDDRVNA